MAREGFGLSRAALARALGIDKGNVSQWERGETRPWKRSIARLRELSAGLVLCNQFLEDRQKIDLQATAIATARKALTPAAMLLTQNTNGDRSGKWKMGNTNGDRSGKWKMATQGVRYRTHADDDAGCDDYWARRDRILLINRRRRTLRSAMRRTAAAACSPRSAPLQRPVVVVVHQHIGVDEQAVLFGDVGEHSQEVPPVAVGARDRSAFVVAGGEVIDGARKLDAEWPCHNGIPL